MGTHWTYSFLLSFVTAISCPPTLRSIVTVSPKRSSSAENVFSMTSVMSFSLQVVGMSGGSEGGGFIDSQHPSERTEDLGIDTLHIDEGDLLLEHHLVQRGDKVGVEESAVEDGEGEDSSDELEVVEVLGVDVGVGVDLEGVVVVCRVLEEAVEGVEHFVREEKEEFPRATA